MKQFAFTREFTSDGHIVSEDDGRYVSRAECERRIAEVREEERLGTERDIARVVQEIAANLNPVAPALTRIATGLRREAVELALAAAEAIAGAALDDDVAASAAEGVEKAVAGLKETPELIVSVPEDMDKPVRYHMQRLAESGVAFAFRVEPHPSVTPGEWRVRWDGGEVSFDRERAVQAVRDAVENHMSAPPEVQDELLFET